MRGYRSDLVPKTPPRRVRPLRPHMIMNRDEKLQARTVQGLALEAFHERVLRQRDPQYDSIEERNP